MNDTVAMTNPLDGVAAAALARYDFSPDSTITLVNVSENTTYRVDDHATGRRAALRVHRLNYHTRQEIESELLWMDALREDGVVSPPVAIAARDGSRVQTIEVEDGGPPRHAVMFDWLPGTSPSPEGDLAPSFDALGSLAAKMHLHGESWQRPEGFRRYTCDYDAALGPNPMWGRWQDGVGLGAYERDVLSRADAEIKRRLTEYGEGKGRFGLTHNDLRPANLIYDGDDLYVIDFDDCGFSWFMYEFASAVSLIEDDPRVGDWMATWLDSYVRHRPLTREDRDILPTLVLFRRLLLVGWVGSHSAYAKEARDLGAGYTAGACRIADDYLSDRFLR